MSKIETSLEQVVGFPVHNMKQQLLVLGIASNSCTCVCPSCICKRENFGRLSERLWNLKEQRRLGASSQWAVVLEDIRDYAKAIKTKQIFDPDAVITTRKCPHSDAPKREGQYSHENSLRLYKSRTDSGVKHTSDKERERSTLNVPP